MAYNKIANITFDLKCSKQVFHLISVSQVSLPL